jgi:hypothetical protein
VLALLLVAASSGALAQEQILVDSGATVKYLANTSDPGIGFTWVQPGFNDAAWASGPMGLGYEDGSGAENLIQTTVTSGASSVYLRVHFNVTNTGTIQRLHIGGDYEDGYRMWINGQPVYLSPEMPSGPLAWNSAATDRESSNATSAQLSYVTSEGRICSSVPIPRSRSAGGRPRRPTAASSTVRAWVR